MNKDDIKEHVDAIERFVAKAGRSTAQNADVRNIKEKLRVVKRSIAQFEKAGISVPKETQQLELSLLNQLKNGLGPQKGLVLVYERLLKVIEDLGCLCKRRPQNDLKHSAEQRRDKAMKTIVPIIVEVLQEMGGSGHKKDVIPRVKEKLTEEDKLALRHAKKYMIKEGILTQDSKRTWTLASSS
ncbi:MAG: hypothetical protein JRJ38_10105 [Deltaproteobacteria bacterium]|nr:hypothetical protein [Deltaproteobacteria bacterium]